MHSFSEARRVAAAHGGHAVLVLWVLWEHRRYGDGHRRVWPSITRISREAFGNANGGNRALVNETMAQLESLGLISRAGTRRSRGKQGEVQIWLLNITESDQKAADEPEANSQPIASNHAGSLAIRDEPEPAANSQPIASQKPVDERGLLAGTRTRTKPREAGSRAHLVAVPDVALDEDSPSVTKPGPTGTPMNFDTPTPEPSARPRVVDGCSRHGWTNPPNTPCAECRDLRLARKAAMDQQDAYLRQKERARLSRKGGEIALADMVPPDLANMPTSEKLRWLVNAGG